MHNTLSSGLGTVNRTTDDTKPERSLPIIPGLKVFFSSHLSSGYIPGITIVSVLRRDNLEGIGRNFLYLRLDLPFVRTI